MLGRTQKKAKSHIFMNVGLQMADISVDNQRANFNTGPYGDPLKKSKFRELGFGMFQVGPN